MNEIIHLKKQLFYIILIISISIRFFHLGPKLDSPNTWRQSDTANYIWDYYKNGIDLKNPSVCWMGGHKTLILEFPLLEACIAVLYHITGPSHTVARIFFLILFLISCWFLYKIVTIFLTPEEARIAVLFYMFMPLSLFYSRAVHIDYSVIFLTLGMVFFYLEGIRKERTLLIIIGSIFCALAFMTKAPYAILFAIPICWYIIEKKRMPIIFKTSYLFIAPLIVFWIWQNHVFTTNASAPEWDFVPGYRKFTYNAGWYYGPLEQRFNLDNWRILIERFYKEIAGLVGTILTFIGLFFIRKRHRFFYLLVARWNYLFARIF